MQLYFVRHGESEANVLKVISNRGYQHPLTEKGMAQANALADRLRDVPLSTIYASPLMRAVQTAQIVAKVHGLDVIVTDALREYDCGVLEGRSDPEAWRLHSGLWDDWMQNHRWSACHEGGESFEDVQRRFVPFIDSLIASYGATDNVMLLVAHGGTLMAMLPLVLANVDHDFATTQHIANTQLIRTRFHAGRLECTSWGDVTFDGDTVLPRS